MDDTPGHKFMLKIYEAIKHGDATHEAWLYWKLMEFVKPFNDEILVYIHDHSKDNSGQSSST